MIEQELKDHLEKINQNLIEIKQKTGTRFWRAFFNGVASGVGYLVGVAIVLVIVGYVLNTLGVIPAFRNEIGRINNTLDELRKMK